MVRISEGVWRALLLIASDQIPACDPSRLPQTGAEVEELHVMRLRTVARQILRGRAQNA